MAFGAIIVFVIAYLIVTNLRGGEKKEINDILPTGQATSEQSVPAGLPATHKVAKGESLWVIAEKYYKSGYNWADIAQANNLTNANLLFVDQELTIPAVGVKTATMPKPSIASGESTIGPPIEGDSYTVVGGNNLWEIAVRAYGDGYKWTEIWNDNKAQIANPNLIYPDQVLKLKR